MSVSEQHPNPVKQINQEQISDSTLSFILENAQLRCKFAAQTASIAALYNKRAGESLLLQDAPLQPLFRLRWGALVQEPQLKPTFIRDLNPQAAIQLIDSEFVSSNTLQTVKLKYIVNDGEYRIATVAIEAQLKPNASTLSLTLDIENTSPTENIAEIIFPVISNVCIEPQAELETLIYPFFSGVKLEAPRKSMVQARRAPDAAAPLTPSFTPTGTTVRHLYSGRLSMPWMAFGGTKGGIALTHLDDRFEVSALAVYAPTPSQSDTDAPDTANYLDLSVSKLRPLAPGEQRRTPTTEVMLYTGSWHQVADQYRAWASRIMLPPRIPEWVRASHALTAHYDFKWQDGTYTHTFADIPELYRRSAQGGINHVLMAGWFTGGFDHMYPEFYPDLQLGTVMDFIDAVRTVCSEGGKPTFYINTSLFGKASQYHSTLGMDWAVKDPAGQPVERKFFDSYFTISCRGVRAYQRHMRDTVRWLVGEVGAMGVYLDTFAAVGPHLCFDPTHGHPHAAHWNRDAIATLRQVEDGIRQTNPEAFTMFEGCSDIYGQWVVAHLIHGWFYQHSFPEMFHYTFPEYVLVDMVYPAKGQSFRVKRISDEAFAQMQRTWVNGCIFWTYDQEDQRFCNFRTDPDMWEYLQQLIKLREIGKAFFGYGVFKDTVGISCNSPMVAKRYCRQQAGHQVLCASSVLAPHSPCSTDDPSAQWQTQAIEMIAISNPDTQVEPIRIDSWLLERWRTQLGTDVGFYGISMSDEKRMLPCTKTDAGGLDVQPLQATAQVIFICPSGVDVN